MNDYLMIGTVLKPQGIRGECKIRSWAADIRLFETWHVLFMKVPDGFTPVPVRVSRVHDGFVYARLGVSSTAGDAEQYRGVNLYVDREHAAPAGEGAALIADLIGCVARDEDGNEIGVLKDVLQYGTVDTWVFQTSTGTLMAPALLSVFPNVDPENNTIDVIKDKLEEVAVRS